MRGNILGTIKFFVFLSIAFLPSYAYAGPVKVALLPWKVAAAQNADFLKGVVGDMLSTKLGRDAARVEVIKGEPVKEAIANAAGEVTDAAAAQAGKKLGADYTLFGSLFMIENTVNMEARLVKTSDASVSTFNSIAQGAEAIITLTDKLSTDVLAAVGAATGAAKSQDGFIIKPDAAKEKPVFHKSAPIDGLFVAMEAADMDGDGKKEFLLVSEKRLVVARADGSTGALETIKEFKAAAGAAFVSVAIADTDNDGVPEAYVSGFDGEKADGLAIEYKDNDYAITAKGIRWFMRAIDGRLVGQRLRDTDGFYGPLVFLKRQNGSIVEAGQFGAALPPRSDIFRFGVFDLTGSGSPEIVSLDQRGHVRVYRKDAGGKWKEAYKSKDYYGGTLNNLAFGDDRPGVSSKEPVQIEGRWVAADPAKDGQAGLIIKRNTPGGLGRISARPGSYTDGAIMSLSWDKTTVALTENWRTRQITGYIADFIIDGETLTVLTVEGTEGLTSDVKSYILVIPLTK